MLSNLDNIKMENDKIVAINGNYLISLQKDSFTERAIIEASKKYYEQ